MNEWHPDLDRLKIRIDLLLGQVGEVDEVRRVINYKPRCADVFSVTYEERHGRYRLTGRVSAVA